MKLLNATAKDIKETLEDDYKKDSGFNEKTLYYGCIQGMKKVQLNKITSQDIEGPVKTFLINWGTMRQGLNKKKGWEKKLEKSLKKNCELFSTFRSENLLLYEDIERPEIREKIEKSYRVIRKHVGPTATSKILHIISPKFFPMWDGAIKDSISKERKKDNINESPNGYYNFMLTIKSFISNGKRKNIIISLSEKCKVSEIRTVDKYFWLKAPRPKKKKK